MELSEIVREMIRDGLCTISVHGTTVHVQFEERDEADVFFDWLHTLAE